MANLHYRQDTCRSIKLIVVSLGGYGKRILRYSKRETDNIMQHENHPIQGSPETTTSQQPDEAILLLALPKVCLALLHLLASAVDGRSTSATTAIAMYVHRGNRRHASLGRDGDVGRVVIVPVSTGERVALGRLTTAVGKWGGCRNANDGLVGGVGKARGGRFACLQGGRGGSTGA